MTNVMQRRGESIPMARILPTVFYTGDTDLSLLGNKTRLQRLLDSGDA
jgi:hypothetical protein